MNHMSDEDEFGGEYILSDEDAQFMEEQFPKVVNDVPTKIQCILYENNSMDAKILSNIKTYADYSVNISKTHYTVSVDDLKKIIYSPQFNKELLKYKSYAYEDVHPHVTTLYFLDNIIKNWTGLEEIVFFLSKDRIYNRTKNQIIDFAYTILEGRLNLTNLTENEDFSAQILYELDIDYDFKNNKSKTFRSNKILKMFEVLSIEDPKYNNFVTRAEFTLSNKFESEDPLIWLTH